MRAIKQLMTVTLLLASLGLAACTGTDLSGTAGEIPPPDDGAAVVEYGEEAAEDDGVGEAEEGESDEVGEPGAEGEEGAEGNEAGEQDAEEGAAAESDETGELGATDDEDGDAEGEAPEGGVEESDEVGEGGAEALPAAPTASATAVLAVLEEIDFDTLSWSELGDEADARDLAALAAYFDAVSRADQPIADCASCLDTVNVLLGGQVTRVDRIRELLEALVADG